MVPVTHFLEALVNFILKTAAGMAISLVGAMAEVVKQVAAMKILLVQDAVIEMKMVT